jgi:ribose-phosphate pyrophosphokinase
LIIIPGPSSQVLGKKIAELLKTETVTLHYKRFPDGESYIRLEGEIKNKSVVVVQTTSPPQDTNLMQLCLIADAARNHGAKKIIAVIPYMAYARQDKQFLPGEAVSIKTIANMLSANGITQLITVNIHAEQALKNFNFTTKNLSAIPLLAEHFKDKGYTGAFALAPDKGATKYAIEAAKILKGEYGWLQKERDRYTGQITVERKKLNVKNKDVIIFDDIISTGGTIVNAVKILKEQGARKIFTACVHPLLINDAQNKIIQSGAEEIIGTDCVPSPVSKVTVAPLIADTLKTLKE